MCGQIPAWQGNLESTCQQFDYWQQAKENISQTFFPTQLDSKASANLELKDPTSYI